MNIDDISLLRLMNLMSPTLPIGGFTYSQGLEWAVEQAWVDTEDKSYQWIKSQIFSNLLFVDLPIIRLMYEAVKVKNISEAKKWSETLLACRETKELRLEETNRGNALFKVLAGVDDKMLIDWRCLSPMNHLFLYALASNYWQIPMHQLLLGYSWSWLENQVASAVKIIPLGQMQGQSLLNNLLVDVASVVDKSMKVNPEDIGQSQFALSIASSCHETQYTRIFRS